MRSASRSTSIPSGLNGAAALWARVIELTMHDALCTKYVTRRYEALDWLLSRDHEVGSFRWAADSIGLNPTEFIERHAAILRAPTKEDLAWWHRMYTRRKGLATRYHEKSDDTYLTRRNSARILSGEQEEGT